MILKNNTSVLETSGDFEELTFGIREEDMGIILSILRDKMYKNPIGSIAREISCNARDANRESGNLNSIMISIRSEDLLNGDTAIVFKDDGPGISPERIADVFINYGASTKRTTNTQTGGFGLGAKVPFSYTDSFVVETIIDKNKYTYIAAIEKAQKGKLFLINKEETTESNGTSIIIPIKNDSDRRRFEEEVYKATIFWSVKPKYINFEMPCPEVIIPFSGEGYSVRAFKNNSRILDEHYGLLIDEIFYHLDTNLVPKIRSRYGSYGSDLVLFEFKTGELTISANREAVQYDSATIKSIEDRYVKLLVEAEEYLQKQFDGASNYFQACIKFGTLKYGSRCEVEEAQYADKTLFELLSSNSHQQTKFAYNKQLLTSTLPENPSFVFHIKNNSGNGYKPYDKRNLNRTTEEFKYPVYLLDRSAIPLKHKTLFTQSDFITIEPENKKILSFSTLTFKEKKSCARELRKILTGLDKLKKDGLEWKLYSQVPNAAREFNKDKVKKETECLQIPCRAFRMDAYDFGNWDYSEGKKELYLDGKTIYKTLPKPASGNNVGQDGEVLDSQKIILIKIPDLASLKTATPLECHLLARLFNDKKKWISWWTVIVSEKYADNFTNCLSINDIIAKFPSECARLVDCQYIYSKTSNTYSHRRLQRINTKLDFLDSEINEAFEFFHKNEDALTSSSESNVKLLSRISVSDKAKKIVESLLIVLKQYPLVFLVEDSYGYSTESRTLIALQEYIKLKKESDVLLIKEKEAEVEEEKEEAA